jgi:two-component system, NarL family, nitrate/nitrite response regulator NarL
MSAVAPAGDLPRRLRVVVEAADPTTVKRLAALVAAAGHEVVAVADADAADAVLSDGSADPLPGMRSVALGAAEGNFTGLLPSEPGPAKVDAALRAVAAGLIVRVPPSPKSRFGPLPDDVSPVLTPREIEVLTALGDGLSNKAAARRLDISPHTIKFHIEQLFRKLGANSRAEAVAKGLRRQIVEF